MVSKKLVQAIGMSAIACVTAIAGAAHASEKWPEQSITMIVPFPAGGGGDTLARLVAEPLAKELGQSIVVDNRAGAGGNIGTSIASRATPDGYTLAYSTNGTQGTNHWLYKDPGYKPDDFEPISRFTIIAAAMAVKEDAPFKSIQDVLEHAKKNPGELTCGSAGNGTTSHLACEMLKQRTDVEIMHVPYKGGAAAMTDLRAGRIDILIDVMPALAGQVKAGTVRLLGVTSDQRVPSNPDVPTFQEAGVPNYSFVAWDGIFAPKGTPEAILDKANQAVQKIMANPDLQKALSSRGAIPSPTSRAELAKFVKEQYDMLGKVVKDAGVTIN